MVLLKGITDIISRDNKNSGCMLFEGKTDVKPLHGNYDYNIDNIKFEQHVGKLCLLSA